MKLSKKTQICVKEELILRINELYHNTELEEYDNRHIGMFSSEQRRWHQTAQKYIRPETQLTILDYGSGTGFVPLTIKDFLTENKCIIFTDVSSEILEICRKNINDSNIKSKTEFVNLSSIHSLPDNSIDIVTMNSVLHHIYDLTKFHEAIAALLKVNGLLIIMHEPNAEFKQPNLISIIRLLSNPKLILNSMVEKSALLEKTLRRLTSIVSLRYAKRNKMLSDIAEKLIEEGLINLKFRDCNEITC